LERLERAPFSALEKGKFVLSSACVVTFRADIAPGKEGIVTKSEFVDQVADRSGLGKGDADKAVNAVLDTIEEVLTRGGEINFTGFGKFSVADRGARQGVNPQTGEKIQIAASKVPRFSAGSALKKSVKSS
jgi:DNA-binding protein HU-beta